MLEFGLHSYGHFGGFNGVGSCCFGGFLLSCTQSCVVSVVPSRNSLLVKSDAWVSRDLWNIQQKQPFSLLLFSTKTN